MSADSLHERLLGRGDLAVVDRDEFELNLDGARVVGWRTGGIADLYHLLAVRRDVGEPVFESIAHNHLGLRIVGTCAVESEIGTSRHTRDDSLSQDLSSSSHH